MKNKQQGKQNHKTFFRAKTQYLNLKAPSKQRQIGIRKNLNAQVYFVLSTKQKVTSWHKEEIMRRNLKKIKIF